VVGGGIGLVHVHERLGLLKVRVQRVARSMITMRSLARTRPAGPRHLVRSGFSSGIHQGAGLEF